MSQPIHYIKEPQLFTVYIVDFASLMDGNEHTTQIGRCGDQCWNIYFQRAFLNQRPVLKVSLEYYSFFRVKSLDIHYVFQIGSLDNDIYLKFDSRKTLESHTKLETSFLLDMENGDLTIQVKIRVLAIIDRCEIRNFNFHDPFEGCVELRIRDWSPFYVSKQLVFHHSPFIAKNTENGKCVFPEMSWYWTQRQFECFLQLLHGVKLPIDPFIDTGLFILILQMAHHFQVDNVLQYCTNELRKRNDWWRLGIDILPMNRVERLIRTVKSEVEFREFTGGMIRFLDQMNSELLKAIVKKFFSFAVNFNKCSYH